ncbi:MAG: hypothetical protein WAO71_02350 [Gallionella sp.]
MDKARMLNELADDDFARFTLGIGKFTGVTQRMEAIMSVLKIK